MIDNLIVIAAYGMAKLDQNWPPLQGKNPQIVVRTDMPSREEIEGTRMVATPYCGYDTGAALWVYWHYPARRYLFVQDSLIPKDETFADPFFAFDGPVLAWVGFPSDWWDGFGQQQAARYAYPDASPPKCIFGPVFMATREALDTLARKSLLPGIPNHKEAAQGKEREWAMAFHKADIPVAFLHDFDNEKMALGLFTSFAKIWTNKDRAKLAAARPE